MPPLIIGMIAVLIGVPAAIGIVQAARLEERQLRSGLLKSAALHSLRLESGLPPGWRRRLNRDLPLHAVLYDLEPVLIGETKQGPLYYGLARFSTQHQHYERVRRDEAILFEVPISFPRTRLQYRPGGRDTEWGDFNQVWHPWSDDERFLANLLDPLMQAFLMDVLRPADVEVYLGDGLVLLTGPHFSGDRYPKARRLAEGFVERIPTFMWSDLRKPELG